MAKYRMSIKEMLAMKRWGNFANELPYFNFLSEKDNGGILLASGSLLLTFEYRGKDLESSTNAELNSTVYQLSNALYQLNEGWSIHVDVLREESKKYINKSNNVFGKNISAEVLDQESRLLFESEDKHYENKFYISFCYLPPKDIIQKVDNMFYETTNNKKAVTNATEQYQQIINTFYEDVRKIVSLLDYSSFSYFQVLKKDEMLSFLNKCINDERQYIKSNYPERNYFLQYVLANKEVTVENYPKIGEKYLASVTIYGFPNEIYPGILDQTNSCQMEYRFNTRFITVSQEKALKEINKVMQKWKTKRKGGFARMLEAFNVSIGKDDDFAVSQEEEANAAITTVRQSESKYGFYTSTILIFNKNLDTLKSQILEMYSIIQAMGFTANIENVNNFETYMGSLPGNTFENVVQLPLFTNQLGSLFPITAQWVGSEINPNPLYVQNGGNNPPLGYGKTRGNTPFKINIHTQDVGHTMIIGPAGSGKSVLLNFIISQFFRYKNAKVFSFDKGSSSKVLCYAFGGNFYDIISEDENLNEKIMTFQPLAKLDTMVDKAWAEKWLEEIAELNKINVDITKRRRIKDAVAELSNFTNDRKSNRTMSALCNIVQDEELKNVFKFYTNDDTSGKMFDGNKNNLTLSNFNVFEMNQLLSIGDQTKIIPLIQYLFREIELSISLNSSPSLIILDEAWVFLDHPIFRSKLKMWLKEMRKYNCAVIFASQNLSDAFNSEIADTLIQECPTKILLSNPEALAYSVKEYYQKLDLNETQIEIIAMMLPKKEYYMIQKTDRRLFNLALEDRPGLFSLIARTSKNDSRNAEKFKEIYKDEFTPKWWQAIMEEYQEKGNDSMKLDSLIESWYKLYNKQKNKMF